MRRDSRTCRERVLRDVAAVGDVQKAQLAAVLHHGDRELPVELGAAGQREALA